MKNVESLELSEINDIRGVKMGSFKNVSYVDDLNPHLRLVNDIFTVVHGDMKKCNQLISMEKDIFIERSLLDCLNDEQTSCFYEGDNIECSEISGIRFTEVIFKDYMFKDVVFKNCIFENVYLFNSNLNKVKFVACNIDSVLMYKSTFVGTNLYDTNVKNLSYIESDISLPIECYGKSLIENIFMYSSTIRFKPNSDTKFNVKNIYSCYDVYHLNEVLESNLVLRNVKNYDLIQCNYVCNEKSHIIDDTFFERLSDIHIKFSKIAFIVYNTTINLKVWSYLRDMIKVIDSFENFLCSCKHDDESGNNAYISLEVVTKFLKYVNSNDKLIDNEDFKYILKLVEHEMKMYIKRWDDNA